MKTSRNLLPILLLTLLGGCAGYQIGNRTLFVNDIRTVHVPVFQSSSFRPHLGEEITEAVCKEITNRTPYRVSGDPNADSVLVGRIVAEGKHVLLPIRTGDPRELQVGMQVQVSWRDRRDNIIRECPAIPLPSDCVALGATGELVPEVGQSVASAQQQAIQKLARQIVSMMEAPW